MATPSQKLAAALAELRKVEVEGIVQSNSLSRINRERLLQAGFLRQIVKGWYFNSNPLVPGGSTAWLASYWAFVRQYLERRFGDEYCLNPESSLLAHGGSATIPTQLGVMSPKGENKTLNLHNGTSIFIYQDSTNFPTTRPRVQGLNVMELSEALARVGEGFFRNRPNDAAIVLRMISDPAHVLRPLLDQGKTVVAGRLAGAFRHLGQGEFADRILKAMRKAGYDSREVNPFERPVPSIFFSRSASPYEIRIRTLWAEMRQCVIEAFPDAPGLPSDPGNYLKQLDDIYAQDAYNSLSIEGYRVTEELIENVSRGDWDPDNTEEDKKSKDALAARGYFEAFQAVKGSVSQIIRGQAPSLVRQDHHDWHQALFAPSVQAGILKTSDLAGYRHSPVVINGSKHVPLPDASLMDTMGALFSLIEEEESAAVRAVLGHFVFVYIHPYTDGNGRLGRFLMNAMLASGGYPWTIIHLETRAKYMAALESASVDTDIGPFAQVVSSEMLRPSDSLV